MNQASGRLSRRLWRRAPGQRFRFWFSPDAAPHLVLEPVTPGGTRDFGAQVKALKARVPDGTRDVMGAVLIDSRGRCVFCGDLPASFLSALAGWARAAVADTPALVGLRGAGAAEVSLQLRDSDAVKQVALGDLTVQRDAALWEGWLVPSAAATAQDLAARTPGERVWFWLSPQAPVPLLVTPVSVDPNMELLRAKASHLGGMQATSAVSGLGMLDAAGRLQLAADGVSFEGLMALSQWVRDAHTEHPGLRRLIGCALLRLDDDGTIAERIEQPLLWRGLAPLVVPETLDEAAENLSTLADGQPAWFWSTTRKPALVSIAPVEGDPEGVAFARRVERMRARAAQEGVTGTLVRLPSGRLLFSSSAPLATEAGPALARAARHPGLGDLRGAQLARTDGEQILHAAEVKK